MEQAEKLKREKKAAVVTKKSVIIERKKMEKSLIIMYNNEQSMERIDKTDAVVLGAQSNSKSWNNVKQSIRYWKFNGAIFGKEKKKRDEMDYEIWGE